MVGRFGVTAFVGVPAMFAKLVNSNPEPQRLAGIRLWLSASDHLPDEVRRRLRQFGALARLPGGRRIPPVLLNGYGMVELGGLAMLGIELSGLPGSGNLCFPVPPFRIRVVDEDNRPVPAGVTGECQIRRRGLVPHYWKDQGDGQGLLASDGWLRTGDLATRNRLGLIRLVGRMKDVIKSGGYSVYLRELEEVVLAHPAVCPRRCLRPASRREGRDSRGGGRTASGLRCQRKRPAVVVQAESGSVQGAAPHLDSRSGPLAAES